MKDFNEAKNTTKGISKQSHGMVDQLFVTFLFFFVAACSWSSHDALCKDGHRAVYVLGTRNQCLLSFHVSGAQVDDLHHVRGAKKKTVLE